MYKIPKFSNTHLGKFRLLGLLEGASFLILLGIAMPLKYYAGIPEFVKFFGWIHGVLFILYLIFMVLVWVKFSWKFSLVILALSASLLPFGTFIFDRELKKMEAGQ